MDLNKVIFETAELRMTIHVESKELGTYKEAINYAFEKYGLVTD